MAIALAHPRREKTATIIRLRQRDPRTAFQAGVEHARKMAGCAERGPVVWQPQRFRRQRVIMNHAWAVALGAAGAAVLIFGWRL